MYDEFGHWHDVYWYQDYWHNTGALFILIILLLAVFGFVYLFQNSSKSQTGRPMDDPKKQDSAMDTLKKRFASGEIDAEEFAQKKKVLES